MAASRSNVSMPSEAEELAFRYRTLVSAQRILDAELGSVVHPSHRDDLYVQRLRRLKTYLRNSIIALERRMEALGIATDDAVSLHEPPLPSPPDKNGYVSGFPPCGPASTSD